MQREFQECFGSNFLDIDIFRLAHGVREVGNTDTLQVARKQRKKSLSSRFALRLVKQDVWSAFNSKHSEFIMLFFIFFGLNNIGFKQLEFLVRYQRSVNHGFLLPVVDFKSELSIFIKLCKNELVVVMCKCFNLACLAKRFFIFDFAKVCLVCLVCLLIQIQGYHKLLVWRANKCTFAVAREQNVGILEEVLSLIGCVENDLDKFLIFCVLCIPKLDDVAL